MNTTLRQESVRETTSLKSHQAAPKKALAAASDAIALDIPFKSLLVPIDFSESSAQALDYAISLAGNCGRSIGLVHVLESHRFFGNPRPALTGLEKETIAAANERLNRFAREKSELAAAYSEVRIGRSYSEICEAARAHGSELIVIGTHGRSALTQLLLGSTAERVVRLAPCSVLVFRGAGKSTRETFKPRNILVPTDLSAGSVKAVNRALALAKQFDARLELVYVCPLHYAFSEYDCCYYTRNSRRK